MCKSERLSDKLIIIDQKDNVATARTKIEAGSVLVDETVSLTIKEEIPFGHKVALSHIPKGGQVIKYGQPIGRATRDIAPGELVHVHNLSGERGRGR